MSTLRHFLTPIYHQQGEGFEFALVSVDVPKLLEIANTASATLETICRSTPDSWGEVTIRGICTGYLFHGVYDDNMELSGLCREANRDSEGPLEITEAQAKAFDEGANVFEAVRFEAGGFSIEKSPIRVMEHRLFLHAYARRGDEDAVSTKDFAFILSSVAAS